MVSLKDIASDVGVSVPLVSKVLNNRLGSTGASKDTIRKIRSAASRLGYRKNQAAAALRTGRQNVIGVFVHIFGEMGSGLIEDLIRGISDGCRKQGLRQQLTFFEGVEELKSLVCHVSPVEMDGLIIAGLSSPGMADVLVDLSKSGIPLVTAFGSGEINGIIPNCSTDEPMIARAGLEHLLERGCKRILAIGPIGERHFRGSAVDKVVLQLGLDSGRVTKVPTDDFGYEHGREAIKQILSSGIEFDGVFAFSDQISMAVIQELDKAGINVPAQVKVIGVDNSPYCHFASVPLSSISGQDYLRSLRATEMLSEMRKGQTIKTETIPPKLFARRSTEMV